MATVWLRAISIVPYNFVVCSAYIPRLWDSNNDNGSHKHVIGNIASPLPSYTTLDSFLTREIRAIMLETANIYRMATGASVNSIDLSLVLNTLHRRFSNQIF
jgi:hypothetical protein